MSFWLALAALAALGLTLLWWPLRRANLELPAVRDDQLRRLREFEAELAADEIDQAVAPALRAELERAVVDALPAMPGADAAAPRCGRVSLAALCLAAPLFAFAIYWQFGSPDIARFSAAHPQLDWHQQGTSMEYLLGKVRARVAADPDDVEAWTLLARTEMELGHYAQAVQAAEHLNQLMPDHPAAMLMLVDALAMSGASEQRQQALALTGKVLTMEPHNPTALVMKGMFQQQDGDAAGALSSWQQAHSLATGPGPLRAEIEELIVRAGGTLEKAAPRVQIKARVSLSPALAAQAAPGDALFIAARAVDGPPMPLAVSRHTVAELPLTLTLDESMAMVPGHSLADVKQFYLVARISHGGTANAAAGDLEGKSGQLAVENGMQVEVSIDHLLP